MAVCSDLVQHIKTKCNSIGTHKHFDPLSSLQRFYVKYILFISISIKITIFFLFFQNGRLILKPRPTTWLWWNCPDSDSILIIGSVYVHWTFQCQHYKYLVNMHKHKFNMLSTIKLIVHMYVISLISL